MTTVTSTNTDIVLELKKKRNTADPNQNGAGSKSDDSKLDLMETANSSDGYIQIHDRCFTY